VSPKQQQQPAWQRQQQNAPDTPITNTQRLLLRLLGGCQILFCVLAHTFKTSVPDTGGYFLFIAATLRLDDDSDNDNSQRRRLISKQLGDNGCVTFCC
jgi:4'-phosphopantetheinyl transferase EntD